jgi:AAA+ superfamily predicted ATPase
MTLDFLKGSAILGVIGVIVGFWEKIKAVLWKILSIGIQRTEIKTEEAHDAVIAYLVKHYKKLSTYDKAYGATNETFRNGKYGLVPFEKFGTNSIIFLTPKKYVLGLSGLPFLFNHVEETKTQENRYQESQGDKTYSSITCFRGTLNIDEIIENATIQRNNISWLIDDEEEKLTRFDIFYLPNKENHNYAYFSKSSTGYAWFRQNQYRLLGITSGELGREMTNSGKALDNLFFPDDIKKLIHIISLWVKSKDWYKEKNIPWKRGWLLYGPPGTGKTALVRAFAEDLDMPIYVFSLSQMSNNDLINSWKNMQLNIPCIALIEDIDNVFHGRKNICQVGMISRLLTSDDNDDDNQGDEGNGKFTPLTFDCLLNCLDGVDKSTGVFTIITTNDITKIDSAIGQPQTDENGVKSFISSRPGRIDKAIELTYMEKENKIQMAKKILGDFTAEYEKMLIHIDKDIQETPAQFQELCAQIAIQEYWKNKES